MTKVISLSRTKLLRNLPNSLAIRCHRSGRLLQYVDLVRAVENQATLLSGEPKSTSTRIIVAINDPIDCLINLFAIWTAGHCAVMINPNISLNERDRVIKKTAASFWIDDNGIASCPAGQLQHEPLADAALILMTSGTTGDPKGVTHSLATLQERLIENVKEIGPEALKNTLCTLPLFFGHGLIGNCLTALYAGQNLHLWPSLKINELPDFGPALDRHDITFFSSVPSFWRMVLATSQPPVTAPRRVHVGSAPLSRKLWADIGSWCGTESVFNTFGMTETANWISGGTLAQDQGSGGFVGQPWGGSFRVWRDGALNSEGQGEVAVKSPGQMLGFWDDPDKTKSVMSNEYMLTGDIGELTVDQCLRLIGRSKHEINVGGIKVLAEEIDMLLEQHPDVVEACGFGLPDQIAGERVAAVVRVKPDTVNAAMLLSWCRDNARADAVPARIEIVSDIPKNDRGKIARNDVRERMISEWL